MLFFNESSVIKREWWYDDAAYNTDKPVLYLALLSIFQNGTATIYVEQKYYSFASEEEANCWLTDEEFRKTEYMTEDYGMTVVAPGSL